MTAQQENALAMWWALSEKQQKAMIAEHALAMHTAHHVGRDEEMQAHEAVLSLLQAFSTKDDVKPVYGVPFREK